MTGPSPSNPKGLFPSPARLRSVARADGLLISDFASRSADPGPIARRHPTFHTNSGVEERS